MELSMMFIVGFLCMLVTSGIGVLIMFIIEREWMGCWIVSMFIILFIAIGLKGAGV